MKNEIVRLGVILMAFAAIAAFALAGTNLITAPLIAEQALLAKIESQQTVLPLATNFVDQESTLIGSADFPNVSAVSTGMDDAATPVGLVVTVNPSGYGGTISIMVGITQEGEVSGIDILSHSETPGLGANAEKPDFLGQFIGKIAGQELTVVKGDASSSNEISALTAATISSRAVTNGVNQALQFYRAFWGK